MLAKTGCAKSTKRKGCPRENSKNEKKVLKVRYVAQQELFWQIITSKPTRAVTAVPIRVGPRAGAQ